MNSSSKIKTSLKDTIVLSFLKFEVPNKLDRSEDHQTKICSPGDYEMPALEKEFHLLINKESDDSCVENGISFDEGNADENFSSENFSAGASSED